jgi:hypothetical protein
MYVQLSINKSSLSLSLSLSRLFLASALHVESIFSPASKLREALDRLAPLVGLVFPNYIVVIIMPRYRVIRGSIRLTRLMMDTIASEISLSSQQQAIAPATPLSKSESPVAIGAPSNGNNATCDH